ncbi:hypothetical protein QBC35DRAFT_507935 [Podospora australis]|uniref:Uncharacterized protein n=1 Tax=Podospora australis TaxID=1536484 RepID=A0AAN7ACF5_9PEZI|nr:hypothetical protein QBC35DRAFT_507935 [Podospora australis]
MPLSERFPIHPSSNDLNSNQLHRLRMLLWPHRLGGNPTPYNPIRRITALRCHQYRTSTTPVGFPSYFLIRYHHDTMPLCIPSSRHTMIPSVTPSPDTKPIPPSFASWEPDNSPRRSIGSDFSYGSQQRYSPPPYHSSTRWPQSAAAYTTAPPEVARNQSPEFRTGASHHDVPTCQPQAVDIGGCIICDNMETVTHNTAVTSVSVTESVSCSPRTSTSPHSPPAHSEPNHHAEEQHAQGFTPINRVGRNSGEVKADAASSHHRSFAVHAAGLYIF